MQRPRWHRVLLGGNTHWDFGINQVASSPTHGESLELDVVDFRQSSDGTGAKDTDARGLTEQGRGVKRHSKRTSGVGRRCRHAGAVCSDGTVQA